MYTTKINTILILGKIQKMNRAEINPEHVQPTGKYLPNTSVSVYTFPIFLGLPIWRDPFDRKKAG